MPNDYIDITDEERQELAALYRQAENYYLDKHDFNAVEWLTEEQAARFRELYYKENGYCPDGQCGRRDCIICTV